MFYSCLLEEFCNGLKIQKLDIFDHSCMIGEGGMIMIKKAVYAGSFDPVTKGHEFVVEAGARIFDELVVAIGENPDKKCLFSLEERLEMLRAVFGHLSNVTVTVFPLMMLVDYADSIGAMTIIRGIRNAEDLVYEQNMQIRNRKVNPNIETIFFTPPGELADVSSSMVKGLVGPRRWRERIRGDVSPAVFCRLERWGTIRSLRRRWEALCRRLGISGAPVGEIFEAIRYAYSAEGRHYHTLTHIDQCIDELDEVRHLCEDADAIEFAIFFHDIVYDTQSETNEEDSAGLAREAAHRLLTHGSFMDSVERLILFSRHAELPITSDEQFFIDIDLSVLG